MRHARQIKGGPSRPRRSAATPPPPEVGRRERGVAGGQDAAPTASQLSPPSDLPTESPPALGQLHNDGTPVVSRDLAQWMLAYNLLKPASLRPASARAAARFGSAVRSGQWLSVDPNGVAAIVQGSALADTLWAFTRGHGAPVKSGAVYSNTAHARAHNWSRVYDILAGTVGVEQLADDDARELWLCGDVEAILLLLDHLRRAMPTLANQPPPPQLISRTERTRTKSHPAPGVHGAARVRQEARQMVVAGARPPGQRTPEPRRLVPIEVAGQQAAWVGPPNATDPGAVAGQVTQLATLLLQQQQLHLTLQQQQRAAFAAEQQQAYQQQLLQQYPGQAFHHHHHHHQHHHQHQHHQHEYQQHGYSASQQAFGAPPAHASPQPHQYQEELPQPHYLPGGSAPRHSRLSGASDDGATVPVDGRWSALTVGDIGSRELRKHGLDQVPSSQGRRISDIDGEGSTPATSPGGSSEPRRRTGPAALSTNRLLNDSSSDDEGSTRRQSRGRDDTTGVSPARAPSSSTGQPDSDAGATEERIESDHRAHDVAETDHQQLLATTEERAAAIDDHRRRTNMITQAGRDECLDHPLYVDHDWLMADVESLRRHVLQWWRQAARVTERTCFLRWMRWGLRKATERRQAQRMPRVAAAVAVDDDVDQASPTKAEEKKYPPAVAKAKGNRRMNSKTARIIESLAQAQHRQQRQMVRAAEHIMQLSCIRLGVVVFRKWHAWHILVREDRPLHVPSRAVVTPRASNSRTPHDASSVVVEAAHGGETRKQFSAIRETRGEGTTSGGGGGAGGPRTCGSCATVVVDHAVAWCPVCGEYLPAVDVPREVRREDQWRLTLEYDRLDFRNRCDRRSPVVLVAVRLVQQVAMGMIAERRVNAIIAQRYQRSASSKQLAMSRWFAVIGAGKFSVRRSRGFVSAVREEEWRREYADLTDDSEHWHRSIGHVMVNTSMPPACTCLRCTIVLIGAQRRLLRAELLDKVVRTEQREVMAGRLQGAMLEYQDAAAHGYRAHADAQEAEIDRAGRFAPLRKEALETNDRDVVQLDTQWLCPAGRRGHLVKRLVGARKVGAMMSLGVVCRVLHFIAMLLQQPWPVRWRDDRAIAREAFAEERVDRGRVEMLEQRFRRGYAKAFEREAPSTSVDDVNDDASAHDDVRPNAESTAGSAKDGSMAVAAAAAALDPIEVQQEQPAPAPAEEEASPTSLGRRRVSFHPKVASPPEGDGSPLVDVTPQAHVIEYDPHDAPSMLSANFDPEMLLSGSDSSTTTADSREVVEVKPPAALVAASTSGDPTRPLGIAGLRPLHVESISGYHQHNAPQQQATPEPAFASAAPDKDDGDAAPLVKVSAPSFHPTSTADDGAGLRSPQHGGPQDPARLGTAESGQGRGGSRHKRSNVPPDASFASTFTLGESSRPQQPKPQQRLQTADTQASSMMSDGSFTLS